MYEIFQMLLKAKGVSAYRVSKETGIPTATFSEWKKGTYVPKVEKLQKIADFFGVTVDYLMGIEKEESEIRKDLSDIFSDINPELVKVIREASQKGYTANDIKLALKMLEIARGANKDV